MLGKILRGIGKSSVFKIILYSEFIDESGPTPIYCIPEDLPKHYQSQIAMKSISLLMGEAIYQSSVDFENLKYFGIIPFPDISNMVGLTYFFLINDERVRGKAKAATITILVDEKDSISLYQNIKSLRVLLDKAARKFHKDITLEEIKNIIFSLRDGLLQFDLTDESTMRLTRKLKVVFVGLDNAGKTSFLKCIDQKYSELMGIAPTKGIDRSERDILGTTLIEWDFGGQESYRKNYFKNAELYLSDIDLLFYIINVLDDNRFAENIDYLDKILKTLDQFKQFPPVIVVFHKVDPNIKNDLMIREKIRHYRNVIESKYAKWNIKFFETSQFDTWSIISAFSYGIALLNPNRARFRDDLKWLTKKLGGNTALLLSRNGIILSDYSDKWLIGKFFELSQASFYHLFVKFEDFGLIPPEKDYILYKIHDLLFIIKRFKIDNDIFYVITQIRGEKDLPKFDSLIGKFIDKIKSAIKSTRR